MIVITSHDNCYTLKRFLKCWAPHLRGQIRFIYYADLVYRKWLPRETYLFTDLERLNNAQSDLACATASQLLKAGLTVFNDPNRVLCRYELLRLLHAQGINCFNAYRLNDEPEELSFPVFLRYEREHQGALSPLLYNTLELDAGIEKAVAAGITREDMLIVEYCNTSDDKGTFRKYAAYMIDGNFLPRHLLFSRHWMSKHTSESTSTDDLQTSEEDRYLESTPFPHESQLRSIFRNAGIDYGRVDYAVHNGKIQVWEINTNPNLVPDKGDKSERPTTTQQAQQRLCAAIQNLVERTSRNSETVEPGVQPSYNGRISLDFSEELRQRLLVGPVDSWLYPLRKGLRPFAWKRVRNMMRRCLQMRFSAHP